MMSTKVLWLLYDFYHNRQRNSAVTVEFFAQFNSPAIHSGEPEEENSVAIYTADNLLYCKGPQSAPQKHFKVRRNLSSRLQA